MTKSYRVNRPQMMYSMPNVNPLKQKLQPNTLVSVQDPLAGRKVWDIHISYLEEFKQHVVQMSWDVSKFDRSLGFNSCRETMELC